MDDLGILELERPVQLSDTIKIACIGTTPPITGHSLITSGWGTDTGQRGRTPRFLQGTEMIVVPLKECKKAAAWNITSNGFDEGSNKIICVKDEHLDSSVCYGDSGGLYFLRNRSNKITN